MSEFLEAERFARELDELLDGTLEPSASQGFSEELALARALCASDLSRESRGREALGAALEARAGEAFRPTLLQRLMPRPRTLALYGGLAAALLAPLAFHLISEPPGEGGGSLQQGFSMRADIEPGFSSQGAMFPGASDPAEQSYGTLARGGLIGASADVITPLNARDPGRFMDASELAGEQPAPADREGYADIVENTYHSPVDQPLSTFSIDVDKASYANSRRLLQSGTLPPAGAVRVEEFVNYFHYRYPEPTGKDPLSITLEQAACPWNDAHKLVRIGLRGRTVPKSDFPPANLVFLVDTSGSMAEELPLVQHALRLLVGQLRGDDRVAIVAYAGAAGLVLPSTPGREAGAILSAVNMLQSGGSTAGGAGIQLAYKVAAANLVKGGNNRVILATDGDFNVGLSSDDELVRLIEAEREKGVFLSVLGVGTGNYQDAKMEQLADKGNGNYSYLDSPEEAQRVLVDEMGGTLLTLAKDVKVQVEFNPARVKAYRLIGYENRALKAEDFNDDKKDAGELGSGQTVTALYEIVPPGAPVPSAGVDELKYQKAAVTDAAASGELLTVKFRYKEPEGTKSRLLVRSLEDSERPWSAASQDFRFAAAAAGFAMLLRRSEFAGSLSYARVADMGRQAASPDEEGTKAEFLTLVEKARLLDSPSLRLQR